MSSELSGVFSALTTPFDANGDVDETRLRAVVDRHVEGGVDGLLPCGSTGDFTSLSNVERKRVVEVVIDQAGGRAAVVPQTGALTAREAIELSKHAADAGADGVLVITPYYEPLGLDEIRGYYEDISAAVDIPVGVYNLPQGTGVNLEPEWLANLADEVENVTFVKDSTGDFTQVGRLVRDHGNSIKTFVGADTLLLPSAAIGAPGVIIGAPNLLPAEVASVWRAHREGRHQDAEETFLEIYPVLQFLLSGGFYSALIRAGLEILDFSVGAPRKPVLPLSGPAYEEFAGILNALTTATAAA